MVSGLGTELTSSDSMYVSRQSPDPHVGLSPTVAAARPHDDLMMTQALDSQLLRQQVTATLSAARRGDAVMQCFVLTAWDEGMQGQR